MGSLKISASLAGRVLLLSPVLVAYGATAAAQSADSAVGDIVHSVVVQRADIFDPSELDKWYARIANGLHMLTKEYVIRRELLFEEKEPYDSARVAETARNLRALGIFRRVTIDTVRSDSGLIVRVQARDAWSTQADLRISSGGNDVAWLANLTDINVLGTGNRAGLQYRKDPDRTAVTALFGTNRFLGSGIAMNLFLDARSDGTIFSGGLAKPFRTLDTRSSWDLSGLLGDFTVLRFRNGDPQPAEVLRRRAELGRLSASWIVSGDRSRQWRTGLIGQLRRDDFVPDSAVPDPFPKSTTGAVGATATLVVPRFVVTHSVVGFGREEDVNIGTTASTILWAAPRAFGYERDGVGASIAFRTGMTIGEGYALAGIRASGLLTGAGLDSGTVTVGGTAAVKPWAHDVFVVHAEAGRQRDPTPGAEFDLGLSVGLRAFPAHSYTGTRMFYWSAEYRRIIASDLLGLFGVALAGLVDHGGAWFEGDPVRQGWDAGFGLRMGINRNPEPTAFRIDLVHRFETDRLSSGWVLSVGQGFPFSLAP